MRVSGKHLLLLGLLALGVFAAIRAAPHFRSRARVAAFANIGAEEVLAFMLGREASGLPGDGPVLVLQTPAFDDERGAAADRQMKALARGLGPGARPPVRVSPPRTDPSPSDVTLRMLDGLWGKEFLAWIGPRAAGARAVVSLAGLPEDLPAPTPGFPPLVAFYAGPAARAEAYVRAGRARTLAVVREEADLRADLSASLPPEQAFATRYRLIRAP